MSSNATNFEQLFVHRGIHTGKQTAFSLSPKGNRLLSATDTGSLVLIDTRLGHMQARIDTTNRFTALAWVSETQAIVAGDEGIIFNVLLHYATMVSPSVARLVSTRLKYCIINIELPTGREHGLYPSRSSAICSYPCI